MYCALLGTFGMTGYYADLLQGNIPDWLAIGIFILPLVLIVFVQRNEAPDRLVNLTHLLAAIWFMTLALGMELGHWIGYQPEGMALYRVLGHLSWTFAWAGIYRRARAVRH